MTADHGADSRGRTGPGDLPAVRPPRTAEQCERRRRFLRRGEAPEAAWNLRMPSANTSIPVEFVKDSPTLLVLAVEDACWQFDLADHAKRRPSLRDRHARTLWKAERAALEARRSRLLEMARGEILDL